LGGEVCPQTGAGSAGQRGTPRFSPSLYSGKLPEYPLGELPAFFIYALRKLLFFKRPASHEGKPGNNKENTMKTKHGLFFGFAVIAIAAIFTFAGCSIDDDDDGPSNPSGPTWPAAWIYGSVGVQEWQNVSNNDLIEFSPVNPGVNREHASLEINGDSYRLTGAVSGDGTGTFKIQLYESGDEGWGPSGDEITVSYEYNGTATPVTLKLTTEGNLGKSSPFSGGITYKKRYS
jgi:hypothetical protein